MKTTFELPDDLLRFAKATAARRGQPLRQLVTEALREKLEREKTGEEKPWMKHFGALAHLHGETLKINRVIEAEFGQIDSEGWK